MGDVDLFVAEDLAASDHDKEWWKSTQCWLHDGTNEGMG